jgi:hypothetical protein
MARDPLLQTEPRGRLKVFGFCTSKEVTFAYNALGHLTSIDAYPATNGSSPVYSASYYGVFWVSLQFRSDSNGQTRAASLAIC